MLRTGNCARCIVIAVLFGPFVPTFPASAQSNVWVDLNYTGQELGTLAAPFDTLTEALEAVSADGTVHLASQDTHEVPTVNQSVRLESTGGSVRIGVLSSPLGSGIDFELLRITEIMYNPAVGGAEYLELQNTGSDPLDISGVYFSNGIQYTFPAETTLTAGERIVLVRDTDLAAFSELYGVGIDGAYGGALSNSGETVALSTPDDIEFLSLTYNDSASWPALADGQGWSLVILDPQGNGSDPDNWRASAEEAGSPGLAETDPNIPGIVINEILPHTDPDNDTIELFNPTASTVDVRGWFLSDNDDIPQKAAIPDRAEFLIPAGGYAVIRESDFFSAPGTGLPGFRLSEFGEEVYIFSADAQGLLSGYSQGYTFQAQVEGVSVGRVVTSDGRDHFVRQTAPSLGSANPGADVGDVVISEIHYNPVPNGTEYLKITNRGGSTVNLYDDSNGGNAKNTYKIQGIGFKFPAGKTLAPGASALIVNMPPEHYKARYQISGIAVYGPFGNYEGANAFGLSNDDETLRLQWPDQEELNEETGLIEPPYIALDTVRYDDDAPWQNADNNFMSISRTALGTFGGEPTNWTAATASYQSASSGDIVADVAFGLSRGFYTGSQSLAMSTTTPLSDIWYTTDGSYPAPGFGTSSLYGGAVALTGTAAVRAVAYRPGFLLPSHSTDATFVIDATPQETAVNALTLIGDPQEELFHPNGVMAINGGAYTLTGSAIKWTSFEPNVAGGFQDFTPVLPGTQVGLDALGNPVYVPGIVPDPGAYNNPLLRGRHVERPTSFEFLDPNNGGNNLLTRAGVRVHGSTGHRERYAMFPDGSGDWSIPYVDWNNQESNRQQKKFSLRLYFRGEYGLSKLDWPVFLSDPLPPDYDKVVLRGGHSDSFSPFMRDELGRRLFIDMGNANARGEIYSLYINGVYRGYYNLTERHDQDFLANRFGATTDWDILAQADPGFDDPTVKEGDLEAWNELMVAASTQEQSPSQSNYDAIAERLDTDAFIDYLLVQLYTGNRDWPSNNWTAARERLDGRQWYFFVWDVEGSFESETINLTGLYNFPGLEVGMGLTGEDTHVAYLYRACALNAGFRQQFSDRSVAHLGPGGALDTVNVQARFDELAAIMNVVMRDGAVFDDYIDTDWIPNRETTLIADLQSEGLYPAR